MKNRKTLLALLIAAVLAIGMFFIWQNNKPAVSAGAKAVTVEVVNSEGETKSYTVNTDAEYLADLMKELKDSSDFTYEASDSDYGMYITGVNGETADYATDGAYWSIYVNDDYGNYGADQQPVTDGETYKFVYEKFE